MSTNQEKKNSILSMITEDDDVQCYEKKQTRFIIKETEEKQSTIVHVPIQKRLKGLGLVVIQNEYFLQIVSIIEDGPADISGMLMPGDILVKIGKTNILGYKLRDLCDLIEKIPVNTKIEVTAYRNYLDLPDDWEIGAASLKSIVSPESDTGSSSEDDNNKTVKFNHFKPISITWHTPSDNLPPVSRAWHHSKTYQRVLVVGPQTDCDIIVHQSFEGKPNSEFLKHSPKLYPYWSRQADTISPSSSSSSSMDTFWEEPPSDERLHKVSPTLKKRNVNDRNKKYSKSKLPPENPKSKPTGKAAILQGKHDKISMTQISNLTKYH